MKNIRITAFAAALLVAGTMADAQELVVRIDDMGALHSVNKASIDTYRNGIATTVEVIAVGSWFPEAVKMLKENPDYIRIIDTPAIAKEEKLALIDEAFAPVHE